MGCSQGARVVRSKGKQVVTGMEGLGTAGSLRLVVDKELNSELLLVGLVAELVVLQ